jgi:hypothetical protein
MTSPVLSTYVCVHLISDDMLEEVEQFRAKDFVLGV